MGGWVGSNWAECCIKVGTQMGEQMTLCLVLVPLQMGMLLNNLPSTHSLHHYLTISLTETNISESASMSARRMFRGRSVFAVRAEAQLDIMNWEQKKSWLCSDASEMSAPVTGLACHIGVSQAYFSNSVIFKSASHTLAIAIGSAWPPPYI